MKKNIIITILTTTIILFTILAIIGMNMEDEIVQPVTNETRDTFIQSCIGENATYAYCACGYDYLTREYGEDGMLKIYNKMTDTNMPDELIKTYNYCKYLNN